MDIERNINTTSNISEAKALGNGSEIVLGKQNKGGLVTTVEGVLCALKHERYRLNGLQTGDYTYSDLVPVCYRISPLPSYKETNQIVTQWLDHLRQGEIPEHATVGVEVEATCYDKFSNLVTPYNDTFPADSYNHPELLSFTLETATTGNYSDLPRTPIEIAVAVSGSILRGYQIVESKDLNLVYSSTAEAGDANVATITPHPYLLTFAPLIAQMTLDHLERIPSETLQIYEGANVDIVGQMREGTLNWPVNALHVHTGVPQIEGLVDPRAAHACGLLRLTEFSKIFSFMLYNTRHLYGTEVDVKDVRSILRRLILSSHDGIIPQNTEALVQDAVSQLQEGRIHSLPRYPETGQHDRMRLRMDGTKKTVESIDAPMNPDLRLVLTWTYLNQIMNIIGLDALSETQGQESKVIPYLESLWGNIFGIIPTLGPGSSYEQDLFFNQDGYEAKSPLNGQSFRDLLVKAIAIVKSYANKYPVICLQSNLITHIIQKSLEHALPGITLSQYLGVENGTYIPNGLNRGLITEYKHQDPNEIVHIQSEATKLQAKVLAKVRDEKDLNNFIGII